MSDRVEISLDNGKYTYVRDGGEQYALRYGERWQDLSGNNLVYWMAVEIENLRAEAKRLDFLGTGKHKDIGLDSESGDTIIFEVRGNINDRQWHELGRGATLREAIDDAMENATK